MSDNVVVLPVITTLDIDPDRILEEAKGKLESCVIVGYDKAGDEFFASSIASGPETSWLLDRAKLKLLRTCDVPDD